MLDSDDVLIKSTPPTATQPMATDMPTTTTTTTVIPNSTLNDNPSNSNAPEITTTNNNDNSNASVNQGGPNKSIISEQANSKNPLHNDHDYCSPNKTQQQGKVKKENIQANRGETLPSSSSTLTPAKHSAGSNKYNNNHVFAKNASSDHIDEGNLSDELSISSSSLSSDDSDDGLVIADTRPRSLAPKDTPSVSRPKAAQGRRMQQHSPEQKVRQRRPRQNTSVTDKSQWITGEDQIDSALSEHLNERQREKRQRKEVHDPDFSRFTSSEYSSSDAGSDGEEDDEDDPNRPWCTCMKPHGDLFMICCDICEYWYHGSCVGVSQTKSDRLTREGKEWFCGECLSHLQNGTPRSAIPSKVKPKKEKKKSKTGRRGRRKKSETATRESARLSSRLAAARQSKTSQTRRSSNKYEAARSESFEEFENNERLKELIKERKKEFFYKRSLAEEAKRREMGIKNTPITTNLAGSLDSLVSSTSTPSANLPSTMKSEYSKERSQPNIVLQINTKKDGAVTAVVKSKKRKHSSNETADDLLFSDPLQISKKPKHNEHRKSSSGDKEGSTNDRNGSKSDKHRSSDSSDKQTSSSSKKKRKDSESSITTSVGSKNIADKLKENLETRANQLKDFEVPPLDKIERIAIAIEAQLNELYKEGNPKYLTKFRSIVFNLKDSKNEALIRNVLNEEISPARLVRMSPDEMASQELAKWRERENKHTIELIKRDAQLAAQQVIVKKTHKGEEVISAPSLNDPDDPTADVSNQEPPTTPTKSIKKESLDLDNAVSSSTTQTARKVFSLPIKKEQSQPKASIVETLAFLDTTKEHEKNHVYDINCRICTKRESPGKDEAKVDSKNDIDNNATRSTSTTNETPQSEPKRLRVSIETSLDLSSLYKLRDQPIIKPTERPIDSGEYSPSKLTPNGDTNNANEDDDEELYDPETMLPQLGEGSKNNGIPDFSPTDTCWSGNIRMLDVGKFFATAKPVSGNPSFMQDDVNQNLLVCGRIKPEQVMSYIKKLKSTSKNQIISIQFYPASDNDKTTYNHLFDYLYTKNRCGVIESSNHGQTLKDFYIVPIHEGGNIPDVLRPIQGPGLERGHPNCLLGLMVKTARPASALSGGSSAGVSSISTSPSTTSYAPNQMK